MSALGRLWPVGVEKRTLRFASYSSAARKPDVMDTATHFLIEFIPLAIVVPLGAAVCAVHRFRRGSPSKGSLARCKYIVFEAEPLQLGSNVEADLRGQWVGRAG